MAKHNWRYRPLYARVKEIPNRFFLLFLTLWLSLALPEAALHIATAQGETTLVNSGLWLSVLFAVVPAMAVLAVTMLIRAPRINRGIVCAYALTAYFLCASQLIYYRVFGTFYSAYSMANGGQVLQFWNVVLTKIGENVLLLAVMAVPVLFLFVWGKKCFSFDCARPKAWALAPMAGAALVQAGLVLCLGLFGTGDMSAYDLYHNNADSYFSVNRLGLLTAFRLDVTRQITGFESAGSISLSETTAPTAPPTTEATEPEQTHQTLPTEETTAPTEPPIVYNMLDIDFEALIGQEENADIREVHQYFAGRSASEQNEYTGIFKDCNLVLITAEAFSHLIIDEDRTPTLYKMLNEGIRFTNYYVPDWGTSTTDGEYAFLTGTVPKSNTWSFSNSSDNAMPLTMCAQLMKLGYNAYAYHGHTYSYYDRNEYLENLGYTYRAYKQGLDVRYTWPESDVEVVDLSTGDFAANEPFTAYYMTISGHREFNFMGNFIAGKNRELVADEPYSENVRAYLSCQLELELALQLLMERLEEAGTLERTVFVLTADHYPNGLTLEQIGELAGHEIEPNFEVFQNGCIIYKPGMTPAVVQEPASHLDLLPTLSNLFGLEFDSRLYMGRDVFSQAAPFVMFRNRSWITDKASYNSNTGEVVSFTDEPVSEEYVQQMSTELSNRFAVSSRILDHDYWDILFGQ